MPVIFDRDRCIGALRIQVTDYLYQKAKKDEKIAQFSR